MSIVLFFFFFKQKTAYEMRISDWSSDVCSSDLPESGRAAAGLGAAHRGRAGPAGRRRRGVGRPQHPLYRRSRDQADQRGVGPLRRRAGVLERPGAGRSEEHTSELQSLMRISYAVFCLKKTKNTTHNTKTQKYKTTDHHHTI